MTRTSRNTISVVIAGGVNLLLIGLLPQLNQNDSGAGNMSPRVVVVQQPKLDSGQEVVEESERLDLPTTVEPDLPDVEINLIMPEVKQMSRKPVELELATPDISVEQVGEMDAAGTRRGNQNGLVDSRDHLLDAESVTDPPRGIRNESPPYPQIARRHNSEGTVKIRILINEHGQVEQAEILECVGHPSFRGAVRKTVPQWRFTPPRHHGQPLKVWCVREIEFKLGL